MASLKQFAVDEHRGAPLRQMFAVRYTQRLATWVKTHAMVHTSVNLLFCAMRWNSTQSLTDTTLTDEQVKTPGCHPLPSRTSRHHMAFVQEYFSDEFAQDPFAGQTLLAPKGRPT